jgi:hypothetical protein
LYTYQTVKRRSGFWRIATLRPVDNPKGREPRMVLDFIELAENNPETD